MTFFAIDQSHLSRLSIASAVIAFRDLLFVAAHRHQFPVTNISISSEIFVPDGGIDASILGTAAATAPSDLLLPATRYQIKTGESPKPWQRAWVHNELFGKRKRANAKNLGEAVRRSLEEGGRYVLVCFGIDPTDKQLRSARDRLAEAFQKCGYPDAQVAVWCQTQLLGLFNEFPGLCLKVSGRDSASFQSHKIWGSSANMRQELHLGPEQQQIVERIRQHLRSGDVGHIRLIGEPGVGKTRLALEATNAEDLEPAVVYVPDGSTLLSSRVFLNEVIQPDDCQTVILVVDDCPPKDRASIWNLLSPYVDRIRLITMDHGPDDAGGGGMISIDVPATDRNSLAAIISDYGVHKYDAERWADFCIGTPRVAHQIGENLRDHPDDLLRNPSTVAVWERSIVGLDDATSENVVLRRIVLRHLALFERFGFEHPVDSEAQFIAQMARECDQRVTWPRFQSIVHELQKRRTLQGTTTLYITPRLFQIHLFSEFWENYGRIDVARLLREMPPQLWLWFVEMLKYAHTSHVAKSAVDHLLSREGFFPDGSFPDTQRHGQMIMSLAETNPGPTLRCLERTVGTMDESQLRDLQQARQFVVWALERIAVWEDCFVGAAGLLLKLAEAENSNNSNNATGTFDDLFSLIPGYGPTQACPAVRLAVLKEALNSSSKSRHQIGLDACKCALSTHGGGRVIGAEHQGLRKTIRFWSPKTWGELWDAYENVWSLLVEKLGTWKGDDRKRLIGAIIEIAWSMLHIPRLAAGVLSALEALADDPETNVSELVRLAKRQLRPPGEKLEAEVSERLQKLLTRLDGHDFSSRLRRYVKFATFEDQIDEAGKLTNSIEQKLDQLAAEALATPDLLAAALPWLVRSDTNPTFAFAFRVGRADSKRDWLSRALDNQEQAGSEAKLLFLCGYLAAVFEQDHHEWEQKIERLAALPFVRPNLSDIVMHSGMTDSAARLVLGLCRTREIDVKRLEAWWIALRLQKLSESVAEELIALQLSEERPELWPSAVQTTHSYYLQDREPEKLPEDLLFRVLTHSGIRKVHYGSSINYYWSRLAAAFLKRFQHRKWDFFKAVLTAGADEWSALSDLEMGEKHILTEILKDDPKKAWEIIAAILANFEKLDASGIRHWLEHGGFHTIGDDPPGPIQYIPASVLFDWIDIDRDRRALWIADILPKTLDASAAGRLTRDFVAKYCSDPHVANVLYCQFHCRGGWGNASDRYRILRDDAQKWLVGEQDIIAIRWINQYIDGLSSDIKRAEIDEERRL